MFSPLEQGVAWGTKKIRYLSPFGRYSIIQRTLQNVAKLQGLSEIILVVADGEQDYMAEHIKVLNLTVPVHIVLGGAERQDSVACGLKAVDESSNIVLVHDGARPLASTECLVLSLRLLTHMVLPQLVCLLLIRLNVLIQNIPLLKH